MKLLKDYEGRDVRLTVDCLAHILEHAEMHGLEAAVAETLQTPQLVIQSHTDPAAELSDRYYLGTGLATSGCVSW